VTGRARAGTSAVTWSEPTPVPVSRLADLYREARFSDHSMTDAHRRQALEALDAIHQSVRLRERPAILPRTS